jgi:hypothetical protein
MLFFGSFQPDYCIFSKKVTNINKESTKNSMEQESLLDAVFL